jgi:hypothetical protein
MGCYTIYLALPGLRHRRAPAHSYGHAGPLDRLRARFGDRLVAVDR